MTAYHFITQQVHHEHRLIYTFMICALPVTVWFRLLPVRVLWLVLVDVYLWWKTLESNAVLRKIALIYILLV